MSGIDQPFYSLIHAMCHPATTLTNQLQFLGCWLLYGLRETHTYLLFDEVASDGAGPHDVPVSFVPDSSITVEGNA